jgi:hypothetical protein
MIDFILVIFVTYSLLSYNVQAFNIREYTHYLDYLPYRNEGLASWVEDFRYAYLK